MKKLLFTLIVLLVVASATTYVYSKKTGDDISYIVQDNIETLSTDDDFDNPFCWSGGPGAISCAIGGGIQIPGAGVSSGCEVECGAGYYACCGVRCTCKKK